MAATSRAAASRFSTPTAAKKRPTQRILWARLSNSALCSGENSYCPSLTESDDMGELLSLSGLERRLAAERTLGLPAPEAPPLPPQGPYRAARGRDCRRGSLAFHPSGPPEGRTGKLYPVEGAGASDGGSP